MAEIKLLLVIQTCIAAPSQWDAYDEDGLYYYMRYRQCQGAVYQERSPDTELWKYDNETRVRSFTHGDHPYDGYLTLSEFAKLADIDISGVIKYRKLDADDHG